jgi:hypothetical protein
LNQNLSIFDKLMRFTLLLLSALAFSATQGAKKVVKGKSEKRYPILTGDREEDSICEDFRFTTTRYIDKIDFGPVPEYKDLSPTNEILVEKMKCKLISKTFPFAPHNIQISKIVVNEKEYGTYNIKFGWNMNGLKGLLNPQYPIITGERVVEPTLYIDSVNFGPISKYENLAIEDTDAVNKMKYLLLNEGLFVGWGINVKVTSVIVNEKDFGNGQVKTNYE